MEIVEFGELDQNLALKGALVAVLLNLGEVLAKLEIVKFCFKLLVGFGSKLPIGFVFKLSAYKRSSSESLFIYTVG